MDNRIGLHVNYFRGTPYEYDMFAAARCISSAGGSVIEMMPAHLFHYTHDERLRLRDLLAQLDMELIVGARRTPPAPTPPSERPALTPPSGSCPFWRSSAVISGMGSSMPRGPKTLTASSRRRRRKRSSRAQPLKCAASCPSRKSLISTSALSLSTGLSITCSTPWMRVFPSAAASILRAQSF